MRQQNLPRDKFTLVQKISKTYQILAAALVCGFIVAGCSEDPQRHLDLGLWYHEKGLSDDAIPEFKEAIRLIPADPRRMNAREVDIVAQAHHNLAVVYASKSWFELALLEANKSFELRPTTKNYNLQELIRKRADMESIPAPPGKTY